MCVPDGAATINAPPIVQLFFFPHLGIYTGAGAREKDAEIILDETVCKGGKKTTTEQKRKKVSPRRGERITPLVVFLRFFLEGTMDLVGTVQLQKTL